MINKIYLWALIFAFVTLGSGGAARTTLAHGGEDHGDEKPQTVTGDRGTISRTARLGALEVMLKHPPLAPDTATTAGARLFVTDFASNEGFDRAQPAVEIEATNNGAVARAELQKTDVAGSYNVQIPALPQGTYIIRVKLTYDGETDTATFSGVEVKPQAAADSATAMGGGGGGEMSWARTALIAAIFLTVLALFGALIYFVLRSSGATGANGGEKKQPVNPANRETVSA